MESLKVVIVGAGAAGRAITLLLLKAGITHIIVTDSAGVIYQGRKQMVAYKNQLAKITNPEHIKGIIDDAVRGADVLIGVSGPGTISRAHVEAMAKDAIVFALANPIPEIKPEDAKRAGACIVATGRSDYPNQVNNALAFPGIFRGVLGKKTHMITDDIKLAAAKKIASLVQKPSAEEIVPKVTHPNLVKAVASVFQSRKN